MKNPSSLLLCAFAAVALAVGVMQLLRKERQPPATLAGAESKSGSPAGEPTPEGADGFPLEGTRAVVEAEPPVPALPVAGADAREPRARETPEANHEAQREAMARERYRRRAAHVAQAFELAQSDEEAVFEVLWGEHGRRAAVLASMREGPFEEDFRERIREEMAEILRWKTAALEARFGRELTEKILNHELGSTRGRSERDPRETDGADGVTEDRVRGGDRENR